MAVVGLKIKMNLGSVRKLGGFLRPNAAGSRLLAPLQAAFITGRVLRDRTIEKPAPFPYMKKKLGFFRAYIDTTTKRFDENTKVIVVDGNIAVGKTTFAKSLAEELDMLYIPEGTLETSFINKYGYDLRDYKHLIPEAAQPFDLSDYYHNPNHKQSAFFQLSMYHVRFDQYLDMLIHILNTGQGVVMDRSVYGDFCFLETMHHFGYLTTASKDYYFEVRQNTIGELMRPHLVIYLDAPVDVLMDRIKKRGVEYELNTKVLTPDYLQYLADVHKNKYLKEIEKHAELLIYDWTNFGDVEVVVEDIERIDFDRFDKYDTKMKDWRLYDESDWREVRFKYTRRKQLYLNMLFNVPNMYAPDLDIPPDDSAVYWDVVSKVPGNRYEKGYNRLAGDTGLLFKTKSHRPF